MKLCSWWVVLSFSVGTAACWGAENDVTAIAEVTVINGEMVADFSAIVTVLSRQPFLREIETEQKLKLAMTHPQIRWSSDWAWATVEPASTNGAWRGEAMTALLQKMDGAWALVEFLPDEVLSADDSEAAYRVWRANLMEKHPSIPAALIPDAL